MRVLKWFGIAGLAAIALTSKVDPAYASDDSSWPHRPITIVLSQPAGSSPDIIARIWLSGCPKFSSSLLLSIIAAEARMSLEQCTRSGHDRMVIPTISALLLQWRPTHTP